MGKFHRFKDPSYGLFAGESFPGSPGGTGTIGGHQYDRINVVSEGSGAGGSANADVQKVGGVNEYTYFTAFGEDGSSLHVNRAIRAVGENCDVLDDALRTNIPKRAYVSKSGGTSGIAMTGLDVFVSDSGSTPASDLVYIVDSSTGRQVFNGTTAITVSDIDDGTPGNSVIGNTWYTAPTLRLSSALPAGTFRVYYGARTSSARIVETEKEAPWEFIVDVADLAVKGWSLLEHGLDERYRRATKRSSADPQVDTAGAGATITRDGQALTLNQTIGTWTSTRQPDPYLALYNTGLPTELTASSHDDSKSGDMGYVFLTSYRFTQSDAGEATTEQRPFGGFCVLHPRDVSTDTLVGENTYTKITKAASNATLNKAGGGAAKVTLELGGYFRNTSGDTAIRLGKDLLLVTFADNTQQAYRIWSFDSDTVANLKTLGGATPAFSADTVVQVEWVQLMFVTGGGDNGVSSYDIPPFGYYAPTTLCSKVIQFPGNTESHLVPEFIGILGGDQTGQRVLRFGYHNPTTGLPEYTGYIDSTGSFSFDAGSQKGSFLSRALTSGFSSDTEYNIAPYKLNPTVSGEGYQTLCLNCTAGSGVPVELTVNADAPSSGYEFTLILSNANGADLDIVWDTEFVFSGLDAGPPTVAGEFVKWHGVASGTKYYMTRTDY